jgi:hypothetical protein
MLSLAYRVALAALVLVAALPGMAAAAVELKPLFQEACADDLLTWEIADAPPAWLGFDTGKTPKLVFTSPNGVIWTRSAYLDQDFAAGAAAQDEPVASGQRVLRVRHTPRAVGVHHWVLQDPAGAELAKGDLAVKPPREHGPVGPLYVSKDNPRLLAFRDGTIFIPIGPNLAWTNPPGQLAAFARYFSALHDNGGNHVRLWCASWCGAIEGAEPDQYRLDQAWLLDRVLALARAHQLRATVVLDNHHDIKFGKFFPYGADYGARLKAFMTAAPPAQYERRLRYVLARWGADDRIAAWELCNEVEQAQPIRDQAIAWVKGAAALLARLDQDNRLRTVSWSGDDWDLVAGLPNLEIVQIHSYVLEWSDPVGLLRVGTRDGVGMLVNNAERANAIGRPFCFGEVGYQGSNDKNPGGDLDTDGLLLRQQLWAGFLLGGYGTGMSWWWDTYIDPKGLWTCYRGFSRIVPHLDWRDKELAPITPNRESSLRIIGWQSPRQALLWPQLRSDTWYAHLMDEKPRPQVRKPVQIRLGGLKPGQRFMVHYLDMVSGDQRDQREATATGQGQLELTVLPPSIDVAMWVESAQ